MKDTFFVVLAGGRGERLWPLSSYLRPKQLIPFVNGTSLLEQTLQRISSLAKNKNYQLVVTNADQQEAVKKTVGKQATLLVEPVGRNTAPAILLSCLEIYEKNQDAVVVILPSDHFIPETEKFTSLLWAAIAFASCHEQIVTLGIKPTSPAVGYGYISYTPTTSVPGWMCYPIQKFFEKPDKEHAQQYIDENMLWNAGIFVAQAKVLLDHYQQHALELWDTMQLYRKNEFNYEQLPALSFDKAILEQSNKLVVFPADLDWHDVGTLPAFMTLKAQYEKESATEIVNVDAQNNTACSTKKVVAFVGVSNVCVVETDEAILVVAQERVDDVKSVAATVSASVAASVAKEPTRTRRAEKVDKAEKEKVEKGAVVEKLEIQLDAPTESEASL